MIALLVITGTLAVLILIVRLLDADGRIRSRPAPSGPTFDQHCAEALAVANSGTDDVDAIVARELEVAELEVLLARPSYVRPQARPPIIPGQTSPSTGDTA